MKKLTSKKATFTEKLALAYLVLTGDFESVTFIGKKKVAKRVAKKATMGTSKPKVATRRAAPHLCKIKDS